MLQRRYTVTAPELHNSLCRKRAVRHILQRKVGRSSLPWRIWSQQCVYRTHSNSTRYILKQYPDNEPKVNICAEKKLNALNCFYYGLI